MPYEFRCQKHGCPFVVRRTDDEEILAIATQHTAEAHGMAIDRGVVEDALDVL
ncbi:DUF1059 domain-containing protein [Haloarchaeobius sp. HME9146]|uniref:DUF1059 domain-containing protein n=1 Tax=Haloarchaeobius sp. HME9146 TaxID=2978732 RepID=UPI0021C23049|nr:DUF1059 domain-containing protein [Haloarchaeobius sp. HME9146]MCT9095049.1 DUF1059 domain-containing protein [Haloarchaeobius sp. HME9146]